MLAPVILFAYRRPQHLLQTIESLKRNYLADQSMLYIFSDQPKKKSEITDVLAVRQIIHKIDGFKKTIILERSKHLGLANSVIDGVSEIFKRNRSVIVLEDDLITSPNFLKFMNQSLYFYKNDKRIFSVSGFNYPIEIPSDYKYSVYLAYRASSWGWGTWKDRWNKADWELKDYNSFKKSESQQTKFNRGGEDLSNMLDYQMRGYIDSWAIRWCYAHYKNKTYCLHPTISKVRNIGLEGSGTHRSRHKVDTTLDFANDTFKFKKDIQIDDKIQNSFSLYFRSSLKTKMINSLKRLIFKILIISN